MMGPIFGMAIAECVSVRYWQGLLKYKVLGEGSNKASRSPIGRLGVGLGETVILSIHARPSPSI